MRYLVTQVSNMTIGRVSSDLLGHHRIRSRLHRLLEQSRTRNRLVEGMR